MKKFIKKNSKELKVSLKVGVVVFIAMYLIVRFKLFNSECTITYLNPWQLYFSCLAYYTSITLLPALVLGLITFFVMKSVKKK